MNLKKYKIIGSFTYKDKDGNSWKIGPGEEVPSDLAPTEVGRLVKEGKIARIGEDGKIRLPRNRREIEITSQQAEVLVRAGGPPQFVLANIEQKPWSKDSLSKIRYEINRINSPGRSDGWTAAANKVIDAKLAIIELDDYGPKTKAKLEAKAEGS